MTSLATRQAKRLQRKLWNFEGKRVRANQRRLDLIKLGKTLVKKEVPGPEVDGKPTTVTTYELPPVYNPPTINIPHLVFVREKCRKSHGAQMKLRPGNKELHGEAIIEDASRTFTRECDKAMSVPAVNGEPLTQE